jgi:ABC-type sugar transport system permease subunit
VTLFVVVTNRLARVRSGVATTGGARPTTMTVVRICITQRSSIRDGRASAMAFTLFVIILVITIIQLVFA